MPAQAGFRSISRFSLVLFNGINPLLSMIWVLSSKIPNTIIYTNIKSAFIKIMGRDDSLAKTNGTSATILCLIFRFVVTQSIVFQNYPTILPPMDVVCPLAEHPAALHRRPRLRLGVLLGARRVPALVVRHGGGATAEPEPGPRCSLR